MNIGCERAAEASHIISGPTKMHHICLYMCVSVAPKIYCGLAQSAGKLPEASNGAAETCQQDLLGASRPLWRPGAARL